ncbi:hypothetical protein B0H21DRAFT_698349 [Amylocystis lapponica]|nr:hypothetical protein B0H21DRAFT_698349 [Amylocystis lapponica]
MAPEPPDTPSSPGPDPQVTPQNISMDPVWREVRESKERDLAEAPWKVKSTEGAVGSNVTRPTLAERKVTKHRSSTPCMHTNIGTSVIFKESPDGRMVTATFEVPGVKKQDMHVSFRTGRLIVSWRTVKTTERREGDLMVRDREERRCSQTIPLPEGTSFDEIRASRDGQHLVLKYPNSRCIRVYSRSPKVR